MSAKDTMSKEEPLEYYRELIVPKTGKVNRELVAEIGQIDGATQNAAFELGARILAQHTDQLRSQAIAWGLDPDLNF